jgi:NADH-quinone oxidoreductase subunit H
LAAPLIAVIFALTSIAVIPFGNGIFINGKWIPFQITTDVNTGLLLILGVTSIGVYGVVLAGWSSNNKYSLLGGLRASAQMVSYEISLGLSLVGVLILASSFSLNDIVHAQQGHFWGFIPRWNIFIQPVGFFCYLMAAYAETNRIPFDLPEAETELVAGYHTEYSAMKFALYFLGEYTHMITTSFLVAVLFFGGWHFPGVDAIPGVGGIIVKLIVFAVKMALFIVFYMLIRWTLPRFRFDQLMGLTWKVLLPLALLNVVCVIFVKQLNQSEWWLLPLSIVLLIVIAALTLYAPRSRPRVPVYFSGHVASGPPAAVHDEAALD